MVCLQLKYKEVYEKSKAQINMDPEAHEIRAAKEAYKNISNVSGSNAAGGFETVSLTVTLLNRLLFLARLQEEVRSHKEQMDVDNGQT